MVQSYSRAKSGQLQNGHTAYPTTWQTMVLPSFLFSSQLTGTMVLSPFTEYIYLYVNISHTITAVTTVKS